MECDIRFIDRGADRSLGRIALGDFAETFKSDMTFWSPEEYEAQWLEGAQRLVDGELKSAWVTSMHDPAKANFISWWTLYRRGEQIVFQEQLLFLTSPEPPHEVVRSLDLKKLYDAVHDYAEWEDGIRVSQWTVNLASIKEFVARRTAI